jgi:hypothetical protein
MSEIKHCDICGCDLKENEIFEFDGEYLCSDCLEEHTSTCDSCGDRIWNDNDCGDENRCLCESCFDDYYVRCTDCDCVINNDYAYYLDEDEDCPYCQRCYNRHPCSLHYYSYKPTPIFYGNDKRYIGVELEIDGGGQDSENAKKILNIVNTKNELIYIKTDGSLDDGMEIVTHPMTLDYHRFEMSWNELSDEAVTLGYLSHKTSTCGLHCHVNRNSFGDDIDDQEACISRVLYFVEHHWDELLKFSRRSESQINRWAARYGFKSTPKEIMDHAKKNGNIGRYACVNLTNTDTIEFRMFRGTLKVNTILATLELVDLICQKAETMDDEQMKGLSWTDFVLEISEKDYPELITYLKERRIYVNEPVNSTEEV